MKGILFDFDVTLADTMGGHYLAWRKALGQYGISVKACDNFPLEGTGLYEIASKFTEGCSWHESVIEELVQKRKNIIWSRRWLLFTLMWNLLFLN